MISRRKKYDNLVEIENGGGGLLPADADLVFKQMSWCSLSLSQSHTHTHASSKLCKIADKYNTIPAAGLRLEKNIHLRHKLTRLCHYFITRENVNACERTSLILTNCFNVGTRVPCVAFIAALLLY